MLSFTFSGIFLGRVFYFLVLFAVISAGCSGFSTCSVKDHVTNNRIYRNFTAKDAPSCISVCQLDQNCSSYNYEYAPIHSGSRHICELSRCGSNGTLVEKDRFWFHQLRLSQIEDECNTPEKKEKKKSFGGLGSSVILKSRKNSKYFDKLLDFLGPKNGTWKRCYRSGAPGSNASSFHEKCDDKGATVTIVRVDKFVFGGYIDVPWKSPQPCGWAKSDQAFLFSLYSHHDDGFKPRKFAVKDYNGAAWHCSGSGPSFGDDLVISQGQNRSCSNPARYKIPQSCKKYQLCTFYTGQKRFTPSDVEVFYRSK